MIISTAEITRQTREDLQGFIQTSRRQYLDQIEKTAAYLFEHREDMPIVLLSGPSGSGKTTSALLLEQQLEKWGLETHTLSMDNYFSPLSEEEKQLLAEHKLDLEAPTRVDADFLNSQLADLADGKEILLPRYDFTTASRVFDGKSLQRKPGEIVIMEGIHALNPDVTGQIGDRAVCLYVSVRTRVQSSDGTILHPKKIRVMRRMLRDSIFRGRSCEDIIKMAPSVDRGENLYIMPYKNRAKYHINTFLPFELSVYKTGLWDQMAELAERNPEIADTVKILSELEPIPFDAVPKDSLLREFIGGSVFSY